MPVPNVTMPPYNAIGLLAMRFSAGWAYGSGAMISPTHILTCAHNLIEQSTQETATQVLFYPAWSAAWPSAAPPPNGLAVSVAFYGANYATGEDAWDIGLVRLANAPASVPSYFFTPTVTDDQIVGQTLNVTGYPSAQNGLMWVVDDEVVFISVPDNLMSYTHDTWAGNSGGPLWHYDSVTDVVYQRGIHTSQDTDDLRQGRLITSAVKSWINGATMQPTPAAFAVIGR